MSAATGALPDATKKELMTKAKAIFAESGLNRMETVALMAKIETESGWKPKGNENLNYSAAQIMKTWGGRVSPSLAGNPEALANAAYGGRMGNDQPGDGWKYRGRGLIQLTGKAQYKRYGDMIGKDLVGNPELAGDPTVAIQIAAAYMKDRLPAAYRSHGIDRNNMSILQASLGATDAIGGIGFAKGSFGRGGPEILRAVMQKYGSYDKMFDQLGTAAIANTETKAKAETAEKKADSAEKKVGVVETKVNGLITWAGMVKGEAKDDFLGKNGFNTAFTTTPAPKKFNGLLGATDSAFSTIEAGEYLVSSSLNKEMRKFGGGMGAIAAGGTGTVDLKNISIGIRMVLEGVRAMSFSVKRLEQSGHDGSQASMPPVFAPAEVPVIPPTRQRSEQREGPSNFLSPVFRAEGIVKRPRPRLPIRPRPSPSNNLPGSLMKRADGHEAKSRPASVEHKVDFVVKSATMTAPAAPAKSSFNEHSDIPWH